ncbi:MAG: hypothetical protein PHF79_02460 [Candidatus Pacebacteria bacterium]|nr:hypothetical protein [Candidatus Paceibacterota bacterium]
MVKPFVGTFFVVTEYSIFGVEVSDLVSSPKVIKMAIRSNCEFGRHRVVPVGGVLLGGFYLGITLEGCVKYGMKRHQRAPLDTPPKRVEELSKSRKAMQTFPPIGFFFDRNAADSCFESDSHDVFDLDWQSSTQDVLRAIGPNHPLITISTEGPFAIPRHLYAEVEDSATARS